MKKREKYYEEQRYSRLGVKVQNDISCNLFYKLAEKTNSRILIFSLNPFQSMLDRCLFADIQEFSILINRNQR